MNYDTIPSLFKVTDVNSEKNKRACSKEHATVNFLLFCSKNKSNYCNGGDNADNVSEETYF